MSNSNILNHEEPQRKAQNREIYDYIADSNPVVTTKEVATQFDVSGTTIRKRLRELKTAGYVGVKRVDRSTAVWFVAEPAAGETSMG